MLQKLPIGIQTFSEIINNNYLYIDKTEAIYRLLTAGKYFFLSRPRRSGKSLTLSTIKSIYQGERNLFAGLWIEDQWDWEKVQPVIHISFSSVDYQESGLDLAIKQMLALQAELHDVQLVGTSIKNMFSELLRKLSEHGKVVLLIDEYDKPIIDYLDNVEQAVAHRSILKTFYSVIKDADPCIEFLLITGVSKFSKVSIFSDLNNLDDLTLDRNFASLTGYTQVELEYAFEPYMPAVEKLLHLNRDELLEQLRRWYDGYSWDGTTRIYNPFSILSFFRKSDFNNFWFETGTPSFLLTLLKAEWLYELEDLTVSERALASYDIENLQAIPILFQTGYLTIKEKGKFGLYTLGYPNAEVKESLLDYMISDLRHQNVALATPMVVQFYESFHANDLERVIALIKSIFKTIPSHIFLAKAEAYYHSLIYLVFFYLGQYTESEVNTNDGRLDCVVKTPTHIYVIEFKLDKSAEAALQQIKDKGYADKYIADQRPTILLGINFSSEQKTVEGWATEPADL